MSIGGSGGGSGGGNCQCGGSGSGGNSCVCSGGGSGQRNSGNSGFRNVFCCFFLSGGRPSCSSGNNVSSAGPAHQTMNTESKAAPNITPEQKNGSGEVTIDPSAPYASLGKR